VAICQNQVMMIPRELPRVHCHHVDVSIEPEPSQSCFHLDYFGNPVRTFAIETAHRELMVVVTSDIEVTPLVLPSSAFDVAWEDVRHLLDSGLDDGWFGAADFRYPSGLAQFDEVFASYAELSFTRGRSLLESATELTRRIHKDFRYDVNATKVDTTSVQAFRLRAGVCQDFAHIQISCLRSLGLAARYVSGYLRTLPPPGKPRLIGADQSHAWISLYVGNGVGWVDFDPTNACLVGADHVPICIGRDYRDVAPMRGVVLGGGTTTLTVSVDVLPVHSGLEPEH
jgi:transglutaminase-like putative cysteine protease